MRLAFAGTPDFAALALTALLDAGHEIALVLTQPDRPGGRGLRLRPSAVRAVALARSLETLTPARLSPTRGGAEAEAALARLEEVACDALVVAAYGLILPPRALLAPLGIGPGRAVRAINIHASLLPRWRGAAPIARAIEAGDRQSGVTLMRMDEGLDTGDIITAAPLDIGPAETAAELTGRLARLGADLLVQALSRPETMSLTPQPAAGVSYAAKILKSEAPLDWRLPAPALASRIRAFNPFPGAVADWRGEAIKFWRAVAVPGAGRPGEVLSCRSELVVACGEGAISVSQLQRPGRAVMPAAALTQSLGLRAGDLFA